MSTDLSRINPLPPGPDAVRKRLDALQWKARTIKGGIDADRDEIRNLDAFLEIQPKVAARLETLSKNLFGDILDEVERNLTYALQDVLGQNLKVITYREVKREKVNITFAIERDGETEDILRGQGGSVCNIMSVGLRLIALSQLAEEEHRRFLVLDEQDCWLRPDLVPKLMAIIHTIARKLQFQILAITHHNVDLLREHADRIYRLSPEQKDGQGVHVERIDTDAMLSRPDDLDDSNRSAEQKE